MGGRSRGADPLAVDADRLGACEPQLVDDVAHVVGGREVVAWRRIGRDGTRRIVQLDEHPWSGHLDQPGPDARLAQLLVELPDQHVVAGRALLGRLDLRPQLEDARLELVADALQRARRVDERRSFLAAVADAWRLGL